jgi:nicotinamidase-related amidase
MNRAGMSLVALAALLAVAPAAHPGEEDAVNDARTALLVIDIQAFYFEGGKVPLVDPEAAARQAGRVLEVFRRLGWPVVHVQHLPQGIDHPDPAISDPQYRIRPEVTPREREKLVGKHFASSFRGTDLEAWLRAEGVTHLVVVGMQTHMCVEAATRAAADLGFEVTVLHDACATRGLRFGGTEVPAAHVHAAALAAMSGSYARVEAVDEWLDANDPASP